MLSIEKIEIDELRKTIKLLNSSDLVTDKIKVIGKKKEDLLLAFKKTVDETPDEVSNDLPSAVITFYNKAFNEDESAAESNEKDVVAPEKKHSPKVKASAKKDPELTPESKEGDEEVKSVTPAKKAAKKDKSTPVVREYEKDEFGYVLGTGANKINIALIENQEKGITKEGMEAAAGRSANSHLYALIKLKGIPIFKFDGKYYYDPTGKKEKEFKAKKAEKPAPKVKEDKKLEEETKITPKAKAPEKKPTPAAKKPIPKGKK